MGVEAIREAHEEPQTEYEEDSLAADLAAAWDEAETGDDDASSMESAEPTAGTSEPDGEGHTADKSADESVHTPAVSADKADDAGPAAKPQAGEGPPVGLSPSAREAWKDTPKAMQAEIAKREADFAKGIQQYAENAKRAEGMDRVLQPYQQYLAMNGGPGQTISTLLQTGAGLQMGTPVQKAQLVAGLIQQFGVDINTLDNLLVGKTPKEKPQDAVQRAVQQAIQPYQQQMEQFKAMQAQAAQAQQGAVTQEVNDFASTHEFYRDVRGDMADLLDMAANRGQQMTMEQAYNKACALHPEISNVLASRQKAPSNTQRAAASSISGGPGGSAGGSSDMDLRATIEDAWANAGRD